MNCQQFQEDFLGCEGKPLSQEAQDHLKQCTECRTFCRTLELVCPVAPSAALDERVMASCHGILHAQAVQLAPTHRVQHLFYAIAAALVVLLGIMAALEIKRHDPSGTPPKQLAQTTGTAAVPQPAKNDPSESELSFDTSVMMASLELHGLELELDIVDCGM